MVVGVEKFEWISKDDLTAALERLGGPVASRSIEIVARMPGDQVSVYRQGPRHTAVTFSAKYGMAVEKGYEVVGLDHFVRTLETQTGERSRMLMLGAPGETDYVLVLLADSTSAVQAVLHVIPAGRGSVPRQS